MNVEQVITSRPPDFEERFIRAGWTGVCRIYGGGMSLMMHWYAEAGGHELDRRRDEYRRNNPGLKRSLWSKEEIEAMLSASSVHAAVRMVRRLSPERSPTAVAVKASRLKKYPHAVAMLPKAQPRTNDDVPPRLRVAAEIGSEKLLRAILKYYRRRMRGSEEIGMRAGVAHG